MKKRKESKILVKIRAKAEAIKKSPGGDCYPWIDHDGGEWSNY